MNIAELLDGRRASEALLKKIQKEVELKKKENIHPKLVIVLVGDNPSSLSYIRQKHKAAEKVGITHDEIHLPVKTTTDELLAVIDGLNSDSSVHGILVQLPLPEHIQMPLVIRAINPKKDVDGFHAYNLGKMMLGVEFEHLVPCTPRGVVHLLDFYTVPVSGASVCIMGRSNIVGKPLAMMLINRGATVTVCHSKTKDLKKYTTEADILIVAIGQPKMVTADMIKKGAIVVDVGITKVENELVGDVDFESAKNVASKITPVPGGVGPMTVACLMENVVHAADRLTQD